MERKVPAALLNPLSLLGAIMATFSLIIILVLLVLGTTGAIANPYTGILTFLIGPMVLVLGLVLIPIGLMRERRRLARLGLVAKAFPILDFNDRKLRRGVILFSAVTAALMSLMVVTTYGAAEFMETREFCGDVCHRVMAPEAAAEKASPHARVTCVSCHIGPGAPWLVKSKISGIRQVVNYTLGTYSRPIDVPIQDLRPSRDTCEGCHWPERFYGDLQRDIVHYAQDEANTPQVQPMIFRVGGSAQGQGIHWHTTAKVYYLPLNDSRTEIGWVRVERPDGSVDEFVDPNKQDQVTPDKIKNDERFMDCIDCHNRAAHSFSSVESQVDTAMAQGVISTQIPFIKQQAMQALGQVTDKTTNDQYQSTLKRIDGILDYYRTRQPEAYQKLQPQIERAVAEVKAIYQRTVFPDMQVGPNVYPDWATHEGCMRCHGKLVGISGEAKGKTIGADCQTCHYLTPPAPAAPAAASPAQPSAAPTTPPPMPHPVQGQEKCTSCHQVAGPGVGKAGGTGLPVDHQGRSDATCQGCHSAPKAASATQSGTQPQAASPTPAPTQIAPTAVPAQAAPPTVAPTAAVAQAKPTPTAAAPAQVAGPPAIPHTTQGRDQCTACHVVGGPGIGAPGGTGIPNDHQGRTDATCTTCHKPA
jgi:fumarate reductase subunit C